MTEGEDDAGGAPSAAPEQAPAAPEQQNTPAPADDPTDAPAPPPESAPVSAPATIEPQPAAPVTGSNAAPQEPAPAPEQSDAPAEAAGGATPPTEKSEAPHPQQEQQQAPAPAPDARGQPNAVATPAAPASDAGGPDAVNASGAPESTGPASPGNANAKSHATDASAQQQHKNASGLKQPRPRTKPNQDIPTRHLYVGNLSTTMSELELGRLFAPFHPESVSVLTNRCYGFVNFSSVAASIRAQQAMHGFTAYGRPMRIEFARGGKPTRFLEVANIGSNQSKEKLQELFAPFGDIDTIAFHAQRGRAFVDFKWTEAAVEAYTNLQGKDMGGADGLAMEFVPKSGQPSAALAQLGQPDRGQPAMSSGPGGDPAGLDGGRATRRGTRGGRPKRERDAPPPMGGGVPEPGRKVTHAMSDAGDPTTVLWVGVPKGMKLSERQLRGAFAPFGEILRLKTFSNRDYSFVEYTTLSSAMAAMANLQGGRLFNNPRILLKYSKSKITDDVVKQHQAQGLSEGKRQLGYGQGGYMDGGAGMGYGGDGGIGHGYNQSAKRARLGSDAPSQASKDPLANVQPGTVVWQGVLTKSGTPVCRARATLLRGTLRQEHILPDAISFVARTELATLANHVTPDAAVITLEAVDASERSAFFEFGNYLAERGRAAVARLPSGQATMFAVPPSDFSRMAIQSQRNDVLFGVLMASNAGPQVLPSEPTAPPMGVGGNVQSTGAGQAVGMAGSMGGGLGYANNSVLPQQQPQQPPTMQRQQQSVPPPFMLPPPPQQQQQQQLQQQQQPPPLPATGGFNPSAPYDPAMPQQALQPHAQQMPSQQLPSVPQQQVPGQQWGGMGGGMPHQPQPPFAQPQPPAQPQAQQPSSDPTQLYNQLLGQAASLIQQLSNQPKNR